MDRYYLHLRKDGKLVGIEDITDIPDDKLKILIQYQEEELGRTWSLHKREPDLAAAKGIVTALIISLGVWWAIFSIVPSFGH